MWNLLVALGVVGGFLLATALYGLFGQQRGAEGSRTGPARLPRPVLLVAAIVSLVLIYLGLNATALAPGPDQAEIDQDIKAFDAEFDDLE